MAIFAALALTACDDIAGVTRADMRAANMSLPPRMGWDGRPDGSEWTQAAMSALDDHGSRLAAFEPKDIDTYCPGYRSASVGQRQAFWAGLLSALAKHESTWREEAVGGGGQWFGLLQISPQTARGYGCDARSGSALLDGSSNLNCAIRIISVTAPRDGVIATKDSRWRGIAADWAPFQNQGKRAEIAAWTRSQDYCQASRKS